MKQMKIVHEEEIDLLKRNPGPPFSMMGYQHRPCLLAIAAPLLQMHAYLLHLVGGSAPPTAHINGIRVGVIIHTPEMTDSVCA